MSLQKVFDLSIVINNRTNLLTTHIEEHNPGISKSEKVELENINMDIAFIQADLAALRTMISACY